MMFLARALPCMKSALRALAFAVLMATMNAALSAGMSEPEVKAALLFNFARFTEWPSSQSRRDLCVIGWTPLSTALAQFDQRPLAAKDPVLRIRYNVAIDETGDCAMVYIPPTESRRLNYLLNTLANRPILTVSDIESFTGAGGMIGIVREDSHIRFDVNTDAAGSVGIHFNAHMLRAAHKIVGGPK